MIEIEAGFLLGGRYQVIKPIGAGGMGAVYLARDARYEDFVVALKVLYPGIIKTREARERFRNEIVASYRVNHPNIVRAYEYFDEDEFQAYAMEYVDGGDLFQKMRNGPLTAIETANILRQSAAGLAAIHAQGIVHRDLKPENIMLNRKGDVKITDFGVARLRGATTITQAGAMVGTPKYLAPEYVETGECDHRGDIYALGVIGYELISGMSPFRADSRVSLMVERLKFDVEPLLKIAPHCSPSLAHVIERAMAVNIHKRYQSAQEMQQDLELIEAGEEPAALRDKRVGTRLRSLIDGIRGQEPAVYAGIPGSAAILARRREQALLRKLLLSRKLWIGVVLLLAVVVGGVITAARLGRASLADLPEGSYRGVVSGVMADNAEYGFRLFKTEAGVFILFGKQHCSVSKLSSNGEFSCGELRFSVSVTSLERGGAVGTMQELGWGTTGTWNLVQSEAGEELP